MEHSKKSSLDALIEQADALRVEIRNAQFFQDLRDGKLNGRRWLWQLLYWSGWFTRALSARSGDCEDERFADVFADHCAEEARHPAQLKQYMRSRGYSVDAPWPDPTPEMLSLRDAIRCVALSRSPLLQVLSMNLISEGAALDFYNALLDHFGTQELHSAYFNVHRDVDDHHRLMGILSLQLLPQPSEADAQECLTTLAEIRDGYKKMLDSWALLEHEGHLDSGLPGY